VSKLHKLHGFNITKVRERTINAQTNTHNKTGCIFLSGFVSAQANTAFVLSFLVLFALQQHREWSACTLFVKAINQNATFCATKLPQRASAALAQRSHAVAFDHGIANAVQQNRTHA
jgi:hypothetical protein